MAFTDFTDFTDHIDQKLLFGNFLHVLRLPGFKAVQGKGLHSIKERLEQLMCYKIYVTETIL